MQKRINDVRFFFRIYVPSIIIVVEQTFVSLTAQLEIFPSSFQTSLPWLPTHRRFPLRFVNEQIFLSRDSFNSFVQFTKCRRISKILYIVYNYPKFSPSIRIEGYSYRRRVGELMSTFRTMEERWFLWEKWSLVIKPRRRGDGVQAE